MKKFSFILAFLVMSAFSYTQLQADGCYLCGSGSSNGCQQCRYGSSDTYDQRKKCEKAGCKVSGTASCSTASNVKVCTAMAPKSPLEKQIASLEKSHLKK